MSSAVSKSVVRDPKNLFAKPQVAVEERDGGEKILRSPVPLKEGPPVVGVWLKRWATQTPDNVFLAEREGGDVSKPWITLSYRDCLDKVERIGAYLLDAGLDAERPVAILSDNSIHHALLMLAAAHVGVPASSVSQAYSLLSKDHGKLKTIIGLLEPGLIYVADGKAFAPALAAVAPLHNARLVCGALAEGDQIDFSDLEKTEISGVVEKAFASTGPDSIAKLLFTSGSTGDPKGVVNTQRMLTSSQEAKAQVWPFLETSPPVIVDWLPWSHTFGANHNFNMVLRNGGTLYINGGKPAPGIFEKTIANLRDVSSTAYFDVPRGLELLTQAMKKDSALAQAFFSRMQVIFYAAAALPQNVWADLTQLAKDTVGEPVAMVSAWGSTETSPLATDCYFQAERSGNIGLPVPGVELKLVPNDSKLEIRVRGPNVTPGYWKRPDLTQAAFDKEGFYKIGDAVRLADPNDPVKGLYFDGRVSEDFKLTSGTWVSVGALRVNALDCFAPLVQDIVIAGQDRDAIGFLLFTNIPACRAFSGLNEDVPADAVVANDKVVARVREALKQLKGQGGGSSSYATRAILMAEPPSVDAGEITDKGYINQRSVLAKRADLVEKLYTDGTNVITI